MQYLVKANFNPRAREGRDLGGVRSIATMRISIHAPVKGATRCFSQREALSLYFNPRAREGRDLGSGRGIHRKRHFNPRAREGRDF